MIEIRELDSSLVGSKRRPEVSIEGLHQRMAKKGLQAQKITNIFLDGKDEDEMEEVGQGTHG